MGTGGEAGEQTPRRLQRRRRAGPWKMPLCASVSSSDICVHLKKLWENEVKLSMSTACCKAWGIAGPL